MKPTLKLRSFFVLAALPLIPLTGCAASHSGFENVVSAVQQRYSVRAQRVPLMGFISFCAHITTMGGVKGMKVAEFDNFTPSGGTRQLEHLIRNNIGAQWQRFVTDRESDGELSLIYARPDGHSMDMIIADYDHGELDLVRMDVNAERMHRWLYHPATTARQRGNRIQNAQ